GAGDRRLERSALVLYKQPPTPEVLGCAGSARAERFFSAPPRALFAALTITGGRTRRTSEEERLVADPEERRRSIGELGIDRRVGIRAIQDVAGIVGGRHGHAIHIAFDVGEMS